MDHMTNKQTIYAISGIAADDRVFQFLNLDNPLQYLPWIEPLPDETLKSYAHRMMTTYGIDQVEKPIILGLSFGGMLATEMAKIIPGSKAILISTSETRSELPLAIKAGAKMKANKFIPDMLANPPIDLAAKFFGTKKKELLKAILADSDIDFTRWALGAIGKWENDVRLSEKLKIHGTEDIVIPLVDKSSVIIDSGTHLMILDKPDEVSRAINDYLKR